MSDTPETDKLISDWYCNLTGLPNFVDIARKLERERGEANTKLQEVSSKLAEALRERDEAREHWGNESMNAAKFFGEKTKAIAERDEAREERDWATKQVSTLQSTFEDWQLKMLSEQAEALQKIDSEYDKLFDEAHQIRIERDEAREQNAKLRDIAERAVKNIREARNLSVIGDWREIDIIQERLRSELDQLK